MVNSHRLVTTIQQLLRFRLLENLRRETRMETDSATSSALTLTNLEIGRYSRQMILPELGAEGQLLLKQSSALIVGVGGLGCPAAMYLAAAGVGTLGLLDYDAVEISNLHRQVIHSEKTVGVPKAESAKQFLQSLNSSVTFRAFTTALTSQNAIEIVQQFSIVLDCTDNVATRYLLNDACVLTGKPLVSGSALRFEGQLTTYNYEKGPCYRCLFPVPPPAQFVTNCSEGGVLGVVPGIIGSLQALEALKILTKLSPSYVEKMLIFDANGDKQFTQVAVRGKQAKCAICCPLENRTITALLPDYPMVCGSSFDDKEKGIVLLEDSERVTPKEFHDIIQKTTISPLIDVREPHELGICALPVQNLNMPYSLMESDTVESFRLLRNHFVEECGAFKDKELGTKLPVFVVCRRGNDSQRAVKKMKELLCDLPVDFKDIRDGLHGWTRDVDPEFPVY